MASTGSLHGYPQSIDHPLAVRIGARIVSYIFHPLFVPVYIGWFLIREVRAFPDRSGLDETKILIQFVLYYTFMPLVSTLLLKGLGFISSIQLKARKDRIIPFVFCEIFYFWGWYVFKNLAYFPQQVVMFGLAIFLASSLGLIFNAYMKISLHAISAGVLSAFIVLSGMMSEMSYGLYISVALLIAGLTCSARLIDSDHSQREVYGGFFVGALAQVVAYAFV